MSTPNSKNKQTASPESSEGAVFSCLDTEDRCWTQGIDLRPRMRPGKVITECQNEDYLEWHLEGVDEPAHIREAMRDQIKALRGKWSRLNPGRIKAGSYRIPQPFSMNGEFTFGRFKGQIATKRNRSHKGYMEWMLKNMNLPNEAVEWIIALEEE